MEKERAPTRPSPTSGEDIGRGKRVEMSVHWVIWLENALIVMAIAALWPAILHWPDRVTRPLLYLALVAMVVIARRRWRRLMNLKKDRKL